jgi:uncharacterized LabA/DUF88 family protein
MYKSLNAYGYELVFMPIVHTPKEIKGNIDAELVLHTAAIEFENYDKAIVVSGDGDFFCLYNYLIEKNKLGKILIPNKRSESSLLKKLQQYKVFLEREKEKIKTEGVAL